MNLLCKQGIGILSGALLMTSSFIQANECCESEMYCEVLPKGKFFIDAEGLYLRAYQGGLSSVCDSVVITDTVVDGVAVSTLTESGHDPHFKWDGGYRVGGGYIGPNSNFQIGAFWTHYNSHSKGAYDWKLDFDVADLLIQTDYQWNCFTVTPFGGVRYAKIDQKLRTNFLNVENALTIEATAKSKQHFWGVGPVIGVEGAWGGFFGLDFYANVSAGLLYGKFRLNGSGIENFPTTQSVFSLKNHREAYQYVVDAGFGLRWKTNFWNDKLLVVQLGFEDHHYFNQNQFGDYGDLSLDGVSLRVSLGF